MSEKNKPAAQRATENYIKRQERVAEGPKRKNDKPEKVVEKDCLAWMRAQGWQVQVYEAKATFDPRRGIYRNQSMKAGNPDCMGVDSLGNAVAVEFKAPKKRSSFNSERRAKQKEFILKRIEINTFACVVDSSAMLVQLYMQWLELKNNMQNKEAKELLLEALPKVKKNKKFTDLNF